MAAVELPPLAALAPCSTTATGADQAGAITIGGGTRSSTGGSSSGGGAGPDGGRPAPAAGTAAALHALLRHRYRIEVPVLCIRGALYVRISAQIYNELGEYRRLAEAVLEIQGEGLLLEQSSRTKQHSGG
jgi:hypothetical protein